MCAEQVHIPSGQLSIDEDADEEKLVDFRRKKSCPLLPLLIDVRRVEIIQHFTFLGSAICNILKSELNIYIIVKTPGQTGLVAAFPPSCTCLVKTEVISLPSHTYSTFQYVFVCIP